MSWHYRLLRHPDGGLALHEVYCDEQGRPNRYTADPVSFAVDREEGAETLLWSMRRALEDAVNRPILDAAEIGSTQDS